MLMEHSLGRSTPEPPVLEEHPVQNGGDGQIVPVGSPRTELCPGDHSTLVLDPLMRSVQDPHVWNCHVFFFQSRPTMRSLIFHLHAVVSLFPPL